MKRLTLLFAGAIMIVLFQNCAQNVDFQSEELLSVNAASGGDGIVGDAEYSEQFKVVFNSEAAPLDMIWVIDNSGSMAQEAALVRNNFDAFLTTLNKSTNFRLLLVSLQSNSGYGVMIPSSFDSKTHLQINQTVGSKDGPSLLLNKLNSLPSGFLRRDSKKIVVFVTDDNSAISASSFMNSLVAQQKWSAKDVSVSSFIGINKNTSPCMDKEGVVYKDLAAQTGGQNYNICMADWSSSFDDLINSSVSKAVRRFNVVAAQDIKDVVEVKIDGVVIKRSLYSFSGKAVTLSDSVSLAENSQVSIRYK